MAKTQKCQHKNKLKVHEWHHQSMGPSAEAWWCPDCGALRKNWMRKWLYPGVALRKDEQ